MSHTALLAQALAALEYHTHQTGPIHNTELAIDALRAAIAAPAEPVAWRWRERPHESRAWGDWRHVGHTPQGPITALFQMEPLYAAPPAAQPVDARVVEALKASAIAIFDGHESPYGARDVIEWYHGSLLVALSATQPAEQVAQPAHPHKWQPYADIAFKCDLCGMVSQSGQESACTAQPPTAQPAPAVREPLTDEQIDACSYEASDLDPDEWEHAFARAIERAVLAAAVPPGHKVVPLEPTEAMMGAGEAAFVRNTKPGATWAEHTGTIYRAMIQAAPERTP